MASVNKKWQSLYLYGTAISREHSQRIQDLMKIRLFSSATFTGTLELHSQFRKSSSDFLWVFFSGRSLFVSLQHFRFCMCLCLHTQGRQRTESRSKVPGPGIWIGGKRATLELWHLMPAIFFSAVFLSTSTLTLLAVVIWLEHFWFVPLNSGGLFTKLAVVAHAPKYSPFSPAGRDQCYAAHSLCHTMPPSIITMPPWWCWYKSLLAVSEPGFTLWLQKERS